LFEDVLGSRGREAYQWRIRYLSPFFSQPQWTWSGQGSLKCLAQPRDHSCALADHIVGGVAARLSPIEMHSVKADAAFIRILRHPLPTCR